MRKREPERLLDLLLVFALIEARSAERLALLGEALPDAGAADLYAAPPLDFRARLRQLAAAEARVVAGWPLRPRIH